MTNLYVWLETFLQKHSRTLSIFVHAIFGVFLSYAVTYMLSQKEWAYAALACLPIVSVLIKMTRGKAEEKLWTTPDDYMVMAFLIGLMPSFIFLRLT